MWIKDKKKELLIGVSEKDIERKYLDSNIKMLKAALDEISELIQ